MKVQKGIWATILSFFGSRFRDEHAIESEGVMKGASKKIFYLIVLVGSAWGLWSSRRSNSSAAQNPASQPTDARGSAATSSPTMKVDTSGVIFISKDQVSQSYAKGAMLYNGNPERNYRVHIFHRDEPGEVEVHTKDTDIFYILEGSALFATGGTMAGGKETAPGEVRGASMGGGVVRQVTKGDVVIIPANVTHWFKEIQQPITYFGIKVR
jgi:quercetin dioxygenase-like cupin family protein